MSSHKMHESIQHQLRWFAFEHLPEELQKVSSPFKELAVRCANRCPNSRQTTFALQKLLEAKDAAVRAYLDEGEN